MSESIAGNLGQNSPAPLQPAAIGCIYATEEALAAAIVQLRAGGIAAGDIHVAAAAQQRADELAERNEVVADVSADDPFRGFGDYSGEEAARGVVDRAGLVGAALGAGLGLALSFTPAGKLIPVPGPLQVLANVLFFFVVGLFIGSVLGASLAPQQSAHAGFRLIDAMQEGAIALVVTAPPARVEDVRRIFESSGATGVTQV